jgi:peptide/nickel transport system permease protein
MLGDQASQEDVEALRQSMGLNKPLPIQYIDWVGGLATGDLGESIFIKEPMSTIIFEHLEPTLILTFYALLFAVCVAIPLGILAAKRVEPSPTSSSPPFR